MKGKILAIDDEPKNLKLIKGFLGSTGYKVITAEDGVEGLKMLENYHQEIKVILLDRMMPNMDGMELIARIKTNPEIKKIPVIMQTAAAEKNQVVEGIKGGVYYYLTKPYDASILISIVDAAVEDYQEQRALVNEVNKSKKMLELIDESQFTFHTLGDASDLSPVLANFFPDPENAIVGINELMINAVEHGNLGIDYDETTELRNSKKWNEEIELRQKLPENINKKVKVTYTKTDSKIRLSIKDEGRGFNWKEYITLNPDRAIDNHGRGILMASLISFENVEYIGCGNEVVCTVSI